MSSVRFEKAKKWFEELRNNLILDIEKIDNKKFIITNWDHKDEGGGTMSKIQGKIIEKGGVNISNVFGKLPKTMKDYLNTKYSLFSACGLSLVIHPKSPLIPTVHSNLRYFELYNKSKMIVDQWFGGGIDLTPYYIDNFDINHFHKVCKISCDEHDKNYYEVSKS